MENEYISVSELTKNIKNRLESDNELCNVFLKGEISNFKNHTSGHFYFSLKDEKSKINAIMFRMNSSKLKFLPTDGMKVLVTGKISVYEPTGNYQIYCNTLNEDGIGNLHLAFEQLKKKLESEGLFDIEHKKKIPKMPKSIGVITASTGAAVRDIMSTINRRYPICSVILLPSLVQGNNAKNSIVNQIEKAETMNFDTLIIGRGGGSIEDLWPFNEEKVARAIYNSKIPIISGVGHENDYAISDFVADLRAPTPTGAAEMAVPNMADILSYLNDTENRLVNSTYSIINSIKFILNNLSGSYILKNPLALYENKSILLDGYSEKLINFIKTVYIKHKNKYDILFSNLRTLDPISTKYRGYGIVSLGEKVISSVKNIKLDEKINIDMKDGNIVSKVIEIKEEK